MAAGFGYHCSVFGGEAESKGGDLMLSGFADWFDALAIILASIVDLLGLLLGLGVLDV